MRSKLIICVIARTASTRLPLKALRIIKNNMCLLDVLVERMKLVTNADGIYLCTSNEITDDIMEDVAERNKINIYRGSADEVIERLMAVGEIEDASHIIRVTGDNLYTDPYVLNRQIIHHLELDLEYSRTEYLPVGATAEVIKIESLKRCSKLIDPKSSEYLMLYLFNPEEYKCGVMIPKGLDLSSYSLTIDTPDDLINLREVANKLGNEYVRAGISMLYKTLLDNRMDKLIINQDVSIRLPEQKQINYYGFRKEIEERINKSIKIYFDLEA